MPEIRTNVPPRKAADTNNYLRRFAKNIYSQMGEDGILAEIFKRVGTRNKWCVEFGAWDGVFLSNTCNLIRHDDWSAVLIEGNAERCAKIKPNHSNSEKVFPICAKVGFTPGV